MWDHARTYPLFLDADQPGSTATFGGPSSLTLSLG